MAQTRSFRFRSPLVGLGAFMVQYFLISVLSLLFTLGVMIPVARKIGANFAYVQAKLTSALTAQPYR